MLFIAERSLTVAAREKKEFSRLQQQRKKRQQMQQQKQHIKIEHYELNEMQTKMAKSHTVGSC